MDNNPNGSPDRYSERDIKRLNALHEYLRSLTDPNSPLLSEAARAHVTYFNQSKEQHPEPSHRALFELPSGDQIQIDWRETRYDAERFGPNQYIPPQDLQVLVAHYRRIPRIETFSETDVASDGHEVPTGRRLALVITGTLYHVSPNGSIADMPVYATVLGVDETGQHWDELTNQQERAAQDASMLLAADNMPTQDDIEAAKQAADEYDIIPRSGFDAYDAAHFLGEQIRESPEEAIMQPFTEFVGAYGGTNPEAYIKQMLAENE